MSHRSKKNKSPYTHLQERTEQRDSLSHVIFIVTLRLNHRLAHVCQRGEVHAGIELVFARNPAINPRSPTLPS